MVNMLAQMSLTQSLLAFVMIVVCILLMIVILLQRGRGGGLSGAFGGGGGSSAFGAKTGDVFTWITVAFTALFILLAIVANFAFDESAVPAVAQEPATEEQTQPEDGGAAPGTEGAEEPGVKVIELGGETTGGDAEKLPIKVTPVAPPSGANPAEPAGTEQKPDGGTSGPSDDVNEKEPGGNGAGG